MKCTNKMLAASLLCSIFLTGCSSNPELTDAFQADRAGFEIHAQADAYDVTYFAEDLCVVNDNVEVIEADTEEALAACFFNIDSKEILYAKNVHEQMYPASTTKIMTALLALKHGNLDDQATVSKTAITFHESGVATAKLKEGDVLTLRQLLHALLVMSANDAANVIAEHIGGSMDGFAVMMNEEAERIGATNTHFVNPHGLHNEEHYTTVYDLYLMFEKALEYDEFKEILKLPSYETSYLSADGKSIKASWSSSNLFTKGNVTVPEGITAVGGKTGTTTAARSCLVQLFEDAEGTEYVAIILSCKERAILYEEMNSFLSNLNN
ncbi:MAG: D-alanyl-D-alanine carboxypeptidase [Lachnospiraceae bacterium]|nr:D-alanyl-D-alanine carboxypeptidase [Lachnospiraceae bacterium]